MKRLLSLLGLLVVALSTFAQTFTVDDLTYYVTSTTDKTVRVSNGKTATGDVVVPETVTYNDVEYSVTAIDDQAFYGNLSITSVSMPSVTSIGSQAFYNCSALTEVSLPAVTSIGGSAFRYCSALTSVSLPVATSIGGSAFSYCSALTSVSLPAATSFGSQAFYSCSNISSLRIGSVEQWCGMSVNTNYGSHPLTYTSKAVDLYIGDSETPATSIEIPSTVTEIPYYAFCRTKITSVSAPAATSIGNSAFYDCSALTSVSLPAATSIGGSAFQYCSALTSVSLPVVTSIGSQAFYYCSALTSVSLPVATSIGSYAFWSCSALTSVSLPAATSIESWAFQYCSALTSVSLPVATSIGSQAFHDCSALTSVSLPAATSIGNSAFSSCSNISSLRIGSVEQWCGMSVSTDYNSHPLSATSKAVDLYIGDSETPATSIEVPSTVTEIPNYAFCSTKITSVSAPAATSIGSYAFRYCSALTSVSLPTATSIGGQAFCYCNNLSDISFSANTPANINSDSFDSKTSLIVPEGAYDAYVEAWSSYANQIVMASKKDSEVSVIARETESTLHKAIGEDNLRHIVNLKVKGSINGYDIMIIRNKMNNLHHLDLSEATIVGNNYEYYTGYHTSDNEIGAYSFYNLPNLMTVKLPEVNAIGSYAFASCSNLREINLPESLKNLSAYAFSDCSSLKSIEIPGSVVSIGSYAFDDCTSLTKVTLHEGLNTIGSDAFYNCQINNIRFPESLTSIGSYAFYGNSFEEVNLPPNLTTIGTYAFRKCRNLKVLRLNPMLKSISNYAFDGCNNLKKVYTYTVEPTSISQDTYSAYKTADLYVPTPSYYTYYYDTQWSQFLSVNKTDEEYDFKSFYINKDYEMDDDTGIIGGNPDAELNENSGLINNGSQTQALGTVTIRFNGNNGSASIIANGNLTADKIKVEITVTGNKWHFFCFPFDVPLSGVSVSGNKAFVFRHYNAELRATGSSGWENLAEGQKVLKAGEGYIFQANGSATLTIEVDNKITFLGKSIAAALKVQNAANAANASWNFVGNPGYSYFNIDDLGFSAPITVWDPNTNSYAALRPGDDDAFIHPFQAFFVQKQEGVDALTFNAADRTTYLASQSAMRNKAKARRSPAADSPRKLVNLSVTDGVNTDKMRVVFNDGKSMAYEMDCDAAKFDAAGVPQLCSIGTDNTRYAINERPNADGTVKLGFTADKTGKFSIMATRMDAPCYLRDLLLNTTHDLSLGAYEFESQKGIFDNRFLLVNTNIADTPTGIGNAELDGETDATYDVLGRKVKSAGHGVYIVNGKKVNVK